MHCSKCGAEVVEEAVFCHQCGARIGEEPGQNAPAPTFSAEETPAQRFRPKPGRDEDDDTEEALWQGSYCRQTMIGPFMVAVVIGIASIIAGVLIGQRVLTIILIVGNILLFAGIALRYLFLRVNVRYELTTQRFVHERGILRRVTDRIEVIDFDDITVEQGPIERVLGIGKIRITSSDRTHPEFLLAGIEGVRNVAGMMDEARRTERRRRGLHIEAV